MTEPTPDDDVVMNLDTMERPNAPKVFDFIHGGRRYELLDPQEVDWQELLTGMSDPRLFFRSALAEKDHQEFFARKMAGWKMNRLMLGYQKHYELTEDDQGAAADA